MNHVALLRGINVGGYQKAAMADLRDLLTASSFSDARTILQSGNLIFQGTGKCVLQSAPMEVSTSGILVPEHLAARLALEGSGSQGGRRAAEHSSGISTPRALLAALALRTLLDQPRR